MFDDIPAQAWLLVLILFWAWSPAQYVVRHVMASPRRRDITKPAEDLEWRSSGTFYRCVAALALLAAFAVFIFTPQAERLVKSAYFFPSLIGLFGVFAFFTVARGLQSGQISPLTRGSLGPYEREEQPRSFWGSMAWNALVGCMMGFAGFMALRDVPLSIKEDKCFPDADTVATPDLLVACRDLTRIYSADLQRNPRDFATRYNRALAHHNLGDTGRAVADYTAAIALNRSDPDPYFNRGLIYLDTQEFDLAIADFTRAHQLSPNDPWARANRGMSHAWKGDHDAAAEDFAAVRSVDPNNIVMMRGETLLAINAAEFDRAIQRASEGLRRYPNDLWLLEHRANVYGRTGKHEKAAADRAKYIQLAYRSR